MYHIGICDDGINICSFIKKCLLQKADRENIAIETEAWHSGEDLWEYLQSGNWIDILFLDIELLDMSGIEIGDKIRNQLEYRNIQIIYISGKAGYARSLFKSQPMDFLVKPLKPEQIEEAFDTAVKIIMQRVEKFEFKNGKKNYFIFYNHIIYFTSVGRKVNIVTADGTKDFYGKLKEVVSGLPKNFIAIHKSYIVNRNYIKCFTYETVEMEDGSLLQISRNYRKRVRQILLQEG